VLKKAAPFSGQICRRNNWPRPLGRLCEIGAVPMVKGLDFSSLHVTEMYIRQPIA